MLFVCHRTVSMAAVYQLKVKYDQDNKSGLFSVANPDFELRGEGTGGFDLRPAGFPPLCHFFSFLPKIKRGGKDSRAPPLDPPLVF